MTDKLIEQIKAEKEEGPDNGDRVCVWGWAGGAAPGGHLSTLSVSYEAADGSRWNRTYRATEGWEEAPLAALRQDEGDE